MPGFQGINVAVVEQFVNVVQVAALQALGNASNLLRRYLVEGVAVDRLALGKVGPAWLQRDPAVRLDQFGIGDVELELPGLGAERPHVVHPRGTTLTVNDLQEGYFEALAAGVHRNRDEGDGVAAREAVDGGEVEIGG